jgi:hypothetical protein
MAFGLRPCGGHADLTKAEASPPRRLAASVFI